MPAGSAETDNSDLPILSQSALLLGLSSAEASPEMPLSLLLPADLPSHLDVTDSSPAEIMTQSPPTTDADAIERLGGMAVAEA
jgi:hypothetical protein